MREDHFTFGFTDEQKLIRESVLDLLARVLPAAKIREFDQAGEYPHEAYNALAEAGWMALPYVEAYGGIGGSHKDLTVLAEARRILTDDGSIIILELDRPKSLWVRLFIGLWFLLFRQLQCRLFV